MTYLELVNAVLRRLRVDGVTVVNQTDYSSLIGALVNQAKREAEDAWPWLALESSVSISTIQGTQTYTLTDFGRRARVNRVHNTTTNARVQAVDYYKFDEQQDFVTLSQDQPSWWRLNGVSGDDPIIEFLPEPDQAYAVKVYGIAPQDDLSDDTDTLTIPPYPVILGAYFLAISERGDDRGGRLELVQREYQSALNDAIAQDNLNRHGGYSSDWRLD